MPRSSSNNLESSRDNCTFFLDRGSVFSCDVFAQGDNFTLSFHARYLMITLSVSLDPTNRKEHIYQQCSLLRRRYRRGATFTEDSRYFFVGLKNRKGAMTLIENLVNVVNPAGITATAGHCRKIDSYFLNCLIRIIEQQDIEHSRIVNGHARIDAAMMTVCFFVSFTGSDNHV